ncbi:hypothetical protein Tco_0595673 [Tanacetum coccineum]
MAQPQQSADVHQGELCPPNKRYALMDTNKKVDLDNPLCLDESRILANVGILDLIRQNKDEDIRRSPYNDKDTKDTEDILRCLKDIICSYLLMFTVIRLRIPPRRSTRLTPPTPIPTIDEADDIILQDTLQVSLAEQKIHEELEATQNVEKVKEHLMTKEIEKLVKGSENVEVASSPLRNDDNQTNPNTRPSVVHPRDQDDPYDDAHHEGENSAKR